MLSARALSQLQDLRVRLLRCCGVATLAIVGLYLFKVQLLEALLAPLLKASATPPLVVLSGVPELFFLYLKITTWGGIFVALPYMFFEVWRFIAPGLYPHERKFVLPALVAVPLLFYSGGVFAYFAVVPAAMRFFLSFSQPGVVAMPNMSEYLRVLFNMSFALGLAFNMPVVLVLLVRVKILKVEQLVKWRRFAIVAIFIFAAVATPPDPLSQVLLAVPLMLLYEGAILASKALKFQVKI